MPCTCSKESRSEAREIVRVMGKKPAKVIPILQEIQLRHGYLPEELMEAVAEEMDLALSHIYGVATFYSQFRFTPVGKHLIKLCKGTACHVAGAELLYSVLCDVLGISEGETTQDRMFTLESVACLGCCSLAPVVMIGKELYGKLTQDKIKKIIKGYYHE